MRFVLMVPGAVDTNASYVAYGLHDWEPFSES